jgi:cyclopropane-fatty-acyl-phospholipid synthase
MNDQPALRDAPPDAPFSGADETDPSRAMSTEDHHGPGGGTGESRRPGMTGRIMARLLERLGNPPLQVVLPGGVTINPPDTRQVAGSIEIRDRSTLLAIAADPMFQFAEAYANGRVIVHGTLWRCLTVLYRAMARTGNSLALTHRFFMWLRRPARTSRRAARLNIHHHYNIGNDFYRLWLDEQLLYTCAYFAHPGLTLEQAQVAKMDHVCRKMRLEPGQEVVEAGCGWGSLALHMAKHYGVRVRAYNISSEQINWARDRARAEGLDGQVEFILDDWRSIQGKYDVFASVGMLEHVGIRNYRLLGKRIQECLRPNGLALVHSIGQNAPHPLNPWIERRIFPGASAPSFGQISSGVLEPAGFSLLDAENLRLHYAETLRHWLARFEDNVQVVVRQFGERFVRIWRFYLSGSIAAFEAGSLQLFQLLFAHGLSNRVPRTREFLYREEGTESGPVPLPASGTETAWFEA